MTPDKLLCLMADLENKLDFMVKYIELDPRTQSGYVHYSFQDEYTTVAAMLKLLSDDADYGRRIRELRQEHPDYEGRLSISFIQRAHQIVTHWSSDLLQEVKSKAALEKVIEDYGMVNNVSANVEVNLETPPKHNKKGKNDPRPIYSRDYLLRRLRRVIAFTVAVGIPVIAIGEFTEAVTKISTFFKTLLAWVQ